MVTSDSGLRGALPYGQRRHRDTRKMVSSDSDVLGPQLASIQFCGRNKARDCDLGRDVNAVAMFDEVR